MNPDEQFAHFEEPQRHIATETQRHRGPFEGRKRLCVSVPLWLCLFPFIFFSARTLRASLHLPARCAFALTNAQRSWLAIQKSRFFVRGALRVWRREAQTRNSQFTMHTVADLGDALSQEYSC